MAPERQRDREVERETGGETGGERVEGYGHSRLSRGCLDRQTGEQRDRQVLLLWLFVWSIYRNRKCIIDIRTNMSRHVGTTTTGCYGNSPVIMWGRGGVGDSLLKRQKRGACLFKHIDSSRQRYTGTPPNCPWKHTHTGQHY